MDLVEKTASEIEHQEFRPAKLEHGAEVRVIGKDGSYTFMGYSKNDETLGMVLEKNGSSPIEVKISDLYPDETAKINIPWDAELGQLNQLDEKLIREKKKSQAQ